MQQEESSIPSGDSAPEITLIGGGATATLLALQFVRQNDLLRIRIFEPATFLGLGRAYSTENENHLLNVPVDRMSAFPDLPEDFREWIRANVEDNFTRLHSPFVPRIWFGRYLRDRLNTVAPGRIEHVHDEVVRLRRVGKTWKLLTYSGSEYEARAVVLATGWPSRLEPGVLRADDASVLERVIQPYDHRALAAVPIGDRIVIVGTALTAIDVFTELPRPGTRAHHLFLAKWAVSAFASTYGGTSARSCTPGTRGRFASRSRSPLARVSPRGTRSNFNRAFPPRSGSANLGRLGLAGARQIFKASAFALGTRSSPGTGPGSDRSRIGNTPALDSDSRRAYLANRSRRNRRPPDRVRRSGRERNSGNCVRAHRTRRRRIPRPLLSAAGPEENLWVAGPASREILWEITAIPDISLQARAIVEDVIDRLAKSGPTRYPDPA